MAGQGQPRGGHRRQCKPGKKPLWQARVAVVECEWRGAGPMNSGAWVEMSVIWFRGARGSASKGCCAFSSKWQLRMFANRLYLRVGARARTRNGVAAIVFSRAVVIRRDDIRTRAGPNLSDRTPSNLWLPEFRTPQLAFRCAGSRQDREFERVSRRLVLAAVGSSHLARREVAREALLDSHRFCGRSRPPDAPRLTLGLVRAGFFVCCDGNSRGTDSAKNLQKCYEWVRQTSVNPLISLVGAPRFELGTPSPPDELCAG